LIWLPHNLPTNQHIVSQVTDWSTHGLVNSTKCLMENFQNIIALSVTAPCDFRWTTPFVQCQCSTELWLGLGLVYKYSGLSVICKISLPASWPVRDFTILVCRRIVQ